MRGVDRDEVMSNWTCSQMLVYYECYCEKIFVLFCVTAEKYLC